MTAAAEDEKEGAISPVLIAPEVLPYVWERYCKVDKEHRRAVMGRTFSALTWACRPGVPVHSGKLAA